MAYQNASEIAEAESCRHDETDETSDHEPFRLGRKFKSSEEVEQCLKEYQNKVREVFTRRDSRKLSAKDLANANKKLEYRYLLYTCKFGGSKPRAQGSGLRDSSSYKVGCEASIRLSITKDLQYLEVVKSALVHQGHPTSKLFFEVIPESRRLSPTTKEATLKTLQLRPNTKLVQRDLAENHQKFVTLKDLANLKKQLKHEDDNDLSTAVNLLERDYGAKVSLLHENNNFQGLFFSTEEMKNDMSSWPEIVLIDGTYKLINMNFTTMILLVEDGNGRGQIAGIGLLATEQRHVVKWFVECFKKENEEACESMKCMMSDKDLTERDVLKEIFPGIPIYICIFHALRTFSRAVSRENMNLTKQQRENSLKLLQDLLYSSSEEDYQEKYEKFCREAPPLVQEYFDVNWHPIKEEWTVFSMTKGNLQNLTNNRLEAINGKLKQVIEKNSSLVGFIKDFFKWYKSHCFESKVRTAKQFLKCRVTDFERGSCEDKYMTLLTDYASKVVLAEIEKHSAITFAQTDSITGERLVRFKTTFFKVTAESCECDVWVSSGLPCRHIFATRRSLGLALYDEELCSDRWTKDYLLQRNCDDESAVKEAEAVPNCPNKKIDKVVRRKDLTVGQKRKMLAPLANDLIHFGSLACGSRFESRMMAATNLLDAWRAGCDVQVIRTGALPNDNRTLGSSVRREDDILPDSMGNLSLTSSTSNAVESTNEEMCSSFADHQGSIFNINLPTPVKVSGRPSGFLKTANKVSKQKKIVAAKFDTKGDRTQKEEILGWLVRDIIVQSILDGEYLIKSTDLNLEPTEMRDSLANESVDLRMVQAHFEMDAFDALEKSISVKKDRGLYTCGACSKRLDSKCILCGSCLLWYDFSCTSLKRLRKLWYCPKCGRIRRFSDPFTRESRATSLLHETRQELRPVAEDNDSSGYLEDEDRDTENEYLPNDQRQRRRRLPAESDVHSSKRLFNSGSGKKKKRQFGEYGCQAGFEKDGYRN